MSSAATPRSESSATLDEKRKEDVEKNLSDSAQNKEQPTSQSETKKGEEKPPDPNLVEWDGPDDVANPKNWSRHQKWIMTVMVSFFGFLTPVASSMAAPALGAIGRDLGLSSTAEAMSLSIFILGFAIGPLFIGPLSELYGRSWILRIANLFFLIFNACCGWAQNGPQMFVFRVLAGIGGSAPIAIGGGVLSDLWRAEERGKAVGIYTLGPIIGPTLGPIVGGWTAEKSTWRWVFWATSLFAAAVQFAGLFVLKETHGPTLLRQKRDRLAKATGNEQFHTGAAEMSLGKKLSGALIRPTRLLFTQPIMQVIAIYMAYCLGLTYLLIVSFPGVFVNIYHESIGVSGLNFLSMGAGTVLGTLINMRYVDKIYINLKEKNDGVGKPEFRLPSMVVGSVIMPIGLFWYGWSVQARLHWIMPNIGMALFFGGIIPCFQSMQGYILDNYTQFAASGLAAATVLRSVAGFAFPLFASKLYDRLDYGWGTTLLALIHICIGIPAPVLFWYFGPKLRAMSKYAVG